jgi:hypothetical protein
MADILGSIEKLFHFGQWFISLRRSRKFIALLASIVLCVVLTEAGQSELLGTSLFRMSARILPWHPLLTQRKSTTATFEIKKPSSPKYSFMTKGERCPVKSHVRFSFERSGDGWVAAIEINDRRGIQPLTPDGLEAIPIEGKTIYTGSFEITSSDGLETFVVIGSSKPFNITKDFQPLYEREVASHKKKGVTPDFALLQSSIFDVSTPISCVS